MRVIAGEARRLVLKAPKGDKVRPTTDRTKETIFNMIQHNLLNAVFLDLFSGSGAIGIEALSRGAKKAYFVENNKEALTCIEENLVHTKLIHKAEILSSDYQEAIKKLAKLGVQFNLVYLDPPYRQGLEELAITLLFSFNLLAKDGIIVCESAIDTEFNFLKSFNDYKVIKKKEYKTNKFTLIKKG